MSLFRGPALGLYSTSIFLLLCHGHDEHIPRVSYYLCMIFISLPPPLPSLTLSSSTFSGVPSSHAIHHICQSGAKR
ncbi:hypothetical protein BDR04DRAFT_1104141 [Suillus decipiens]|nr:hypothetical protein BDR04DRAFT_1104141 [Suillus decipiens]